jgi:hypothetical protein
MKMKPKIVIPRDLHRKIQYFVDRSDVEVSGLGTIIWNKDKNQFEVTSVHALSQKNSAASTELDAEAICDLMSKLGVAQVEHLKFWWHSHVNMGVFWSGTDHEAIKQIGGQGWVVASVFNKKKEVKSAYYTGQHLFPVFIDDLTLEVEGENSIPEEWVAEYDATCKRDYPIQPALTPVGSGEWMTRNAGNSTDITNPDLIRAIEENRRPAWLTKREWKQCKREYRGNSIGNLINKVGSDEDDFVKGYPLTQQEISYLGALGIDLPEVDYMLMHGYSREEILDLAADYPAIQLDDDIPVHDRRYEQ